MVRPRKLRSEPISGVVGYLRVSTVDQADSHLGLDAKRRALAAEADRRGLELLRVHVDPGISGKSLDRPGLTTAMAELDAGRGTVLMVAKLDRLTRSMRDLVTLVEHSDRAGWGLVALDAPWTPPPRRGRR